MSAQLDTITPIETTDLFEIPHTFEIRPDMHAQAVAVAAERARQEMFEACVKALCIQCRDGYAPMNSFHYGAKECRAAALHATFPERSAALNARA